MGQGIKTELDRGVQSTPVCAASGLTRPVCDVLHV